MEIFAFLIFAYNGTAISPLRVAINFGALQAWTPHESNGIQRYLVAFTQSIFNSRPGENFVVDDGYFLTQGRMEDGYATLLIARPGFPQDLGYYALRQMADEYPATLSLAPSEMDKVYLDLARLLGKYQRAINKASLTSFQTRGKIPHIRQFTSLHGLFRFGHQPMSVICHKCQTSCVPSCVHLAGYACCCPWTAHQREL
jgi:hypothetical protein